MKLVVIAWVLTPSHTPPSVRAELVEAGARSLILLHACVKGGSRVIAPAGDSLSFASPKESKQRKGDPQSATPSLRYGVNLRRCGCGVRCGTHCAAWQLRSDSRSGSVHEARALRRACHPATAPPQAQPAGGGQPNSRTATRAIAALGSVSAARGASARETGPSAAKRSNGPCGCPLPGFPSARAEKRRAGGACVCRRTHALRALTCRSCLNGARSAQ